jgi:hypothetical protein
MPFSSKVVKRQPEWFLVTGARFLVSVSGSWFPSQKPEARSLKPLLGKWSNSHPGESK